MRNQMTRQKKIRIGIIAAVTFWGIFFAAVILLYILLSSWKKPILSQIDNLNLPEGCEEVHPAKVRWSDANWEHIEGEKIIKCDLGYEAAKQYIESHNTKEQLEYIRIHEYGGMVSDPIYDAEFDRQYEKQSREEKDKYVKISYFRRL